MAVTIRAATYDDIDTILALGRAAHAASADASIALDEQQCRMTAAQLIASDDGLLLVAFVDGELVGVLAAICQRLFFSRAKYATDLFTYASRANVGWRLVREFVRWARRRRAAQILLGISFGGERAARTEQLYARMGYERVGAIFRVR